MQTLFKPCVYESCKNPPCEDGAELDEDGVEPESMFDSPAPTALSVLKNWSFLAGSSEHPANSVKLTNPKTRDLYISFSHSVVGLKNAKQCEALQTLNAY